MLSLRSLERSFEELKKPHTDRDPAPPYFENTCWPRERGDSGVAGTQESIQQIKNFVQTPKQIRWRLRE